MFLTKLFNLQTKRIKKKFDKILKAKGDDTIFFLKGIIFLCFNFGTLIFNFSQTIKLNSFS